jgi:hypothetical protein
MARKRIYSCLFLSGFLALAAAFLWGQQKTEPSDATNAEQGGFKIRTEVNMVNVPVTVRRPEGGFIKGLSQGSFQVFEDGVPQEIVFFAQEGLPVRMQRNDLSKISSRKMSFR